MNTIRFCIEWIQTFWPHLPLIPPGSMRSWRTWQKVTRANCTSSRWFMMCGGITRRYKHTEQLQIEEVQTWNTSVIQWWRQCWCFFGVFLCKNVHFECGVWRNVSLLHDRWSQCWWTKWFGRRLLTVPLLLTGSSLKIWPMSSPGEMWEINSTSVLFLIRGYKKIVQRICIYPVNSVFSFWLPPQNTLLSSSRLFIWEILHSTIRKMDKHVQKIQQELEEAKDKLEKQQHKRVTSSNT